jgi:peptidoglycan/xylan/chitin deacetylase (PgdA/CDA1 family)
MDHENMNSHNGFSRSRRDRLIWLSIAVSVILLGAVALWLAVRTRADAGGAPWWREHRLEDTETSDTPLPEGVPAALYPTYPSPFRPRGGEADETTDETTDETVDETTDETVDETAGEEEGVASGETAPNGGEPPHTPRKPEEMIYYSHPNDRMEIALTFDDGPHPRLTPVILDILAEYGIKATFFMVGENVGYYPDAARAVAEAGHEIGNHTFSHRKFGRMGEEELLREIANCEAAVSGFSDAPLRLIRPPEGQMSDAMRRVIGSLDYRVILWDVDTRDWAHTSPEDITRHILDTVEAGDIILMHDFIGYDSPTPAALRLVIPALLERGYRFVTVGELIDGE